MRFGAHCLVVLTVLLGCDGYSGVRGTVFDRYLSSSGTRELPVDLSSTTIEALVLGESGYETWIGSGSSSGRFEIPDAPEGELLVRVGDVYVATDQRRLDLGQLRRGRPPSVARPEVVRLDLRKMTPFDAGRDELILLIPNAGLSHTIGARDGTQGVRLNLDWVELDEDLGDVALVMHRRRAPGTSDDRVFELLEDPITVFDGARLTLEGQFEGGPVNDVAGELDRLEWDSLQRALAHPGELIKPTEIRVTVRTNWYARATPVRAMDAIDRLARWRSDSSDQVTMSYVNPTGAAPIQHTEIIHRHGLSAGVGAMSYVVVQDWVGASFEPRISPVRSPTIDGVDALEPATISTVSPELRWSRPSRGSPDAYVVTVSTGIDTRVPVATIVTTKTAVVIPPGLLERGQPFYFDIEAIDRDGTDFSGAPFAHDSPTLAAASRSTALVEVADN